MRNRDIEEWDNEEEIRRKKIEKRKKKRRKKKLRKIAFVLFLILMVGLGSACFYISHVLNSVNRTDFDDSHVNLGIDTSIIKSDQIVNIALFGIDSRNDDGTGLSDAIMIASVDCKHNKVKLTSIMRDSQVDIDGYGAKKINSAYSRGGAELAVKTLNQNFKMNIKDYVTVNFYQLADVIDALGGIEVDVSDAVRKNANKYIKEVADAKGLKAQTIKKAGLQTLTGAQAVGYARVRYVGNSDFQRTERQREVLGKLFDKVVSMSPIRYPELLKDILPMVETSLTNKEILSLGTALMIGGKPEFEEARFPLDGQYKSNGSNLVYDLDAAADKLHEFIYDDVDFYQTEEDDEKTNSAENKEA